MGQKDAFSKSSNQPNAETRTRVMPHVQHPIVASSACPKTPSLPGILTCRQSAPTVRSQLCSPQVIEGAAPELPGSDRCCFCWPTRRSPPALQEYQRNDLRPSSSESAPTVHNQLCSPQVIEGAAPELPGSDLCCFCWHTRRSPPALQEYQRNDLWPARRRPRLPRLTDSWWC